MPEQLEGGRLKGGIPRAHLDWVRNQRGDAGIEDILGRLPKSAANEMRHVLATTWCSFASVMLLDRAIADAFRETHPHAVRDLGRWSAEQNLSTTYRVFKRADIHEFFERSAALHAQFQDFGTEVYERVGESAGRMTHRNYMTFSPTFCDSACGYYEGVLRMHGAARAVVDHSVCQGRGAKECVFELRWS
jgi:predicted hydrocarbon binding protein